MSTLSAPVGPTLPSRRDRASQIVAAAVRRGVIAAAVACVAWLLAAAIAGTAFLVLVAATVIVAGMTLLADRVVPTSWWIGLVVAWAIVLLERNIVGGHAGVWVAAAAWFGVISGARSAGIARWGLPLLLYPLISVAICIVAGQPLLHPWGVSWLWLAAVLGPPLGVRALLNPSPREPVKR
jgi:hypothetical protein